MKKTRFNIKIFIYFFILIFSLKFSNSFIKNYNYFKIIENLILYLSSNIFDKLSTTTLQSQIYFY